MGYFMSYSPGNMHILFQMNVDIVLFITISGSHAVCIDHYIQFKCFLQITLFWN